jgi:hypothetical protein
MLGIVVVELQLTLSPQAAAAASVVGGPTGIYHSDGRCLGLAATDPCYSAAAAKALH